MTDATDAAEPGYISDGLIEEAVGRLDMSARLEGPNRTLFLDVRLPPGAEDIHGALLFLMRAAVELHAEIQSGEDLSDIEETLEDALKADDGRNIDDGLDVYRAYLGAGLKAIWRGRGGPGRLDRLSAAQAKPWTA